MDWNELKEMADERKKMLLKAMDHRESYSGRDLMVMAGVFTLVGIVIGLMLAPSRKRLTIENIYGHVGEGDALQERTHDCGKHRHGGHHGKKHHGCCSGHEDNAGSEDCEI